MFWHSLANIKQLSHTLCRNFERIFSPNRLTKTATPRIHFNFIFFGQNTTGSFWWWYSFLEEQQTRVAFDFSFFLKAQTALGASWGGPSTTFPFSLHPKKKKPFLFHFLFFPQPTELWNPVTIVQIDLGNSLNKSHTQWKWNHFVAKWFDIFPTNCATPPRRVW